MGNERNKQIKVTTDTITGKQSILRLANTAELMTASILLCRTSEFKVSFCRTWVRLGVLKGVKQGISLHKSDQEEAEKWKDRGDS